MTNDKFKTFTDKPIMEFNSKKKLIIFDMDGVLIDSEKISRQYAMEQFPTMTEEFHKELLSGNFHEGIEEFKKNNPASNETAEEKEIRQVAFSEKKMQCEMFEGMYELVKSLYEQGYILAINTSAIERSCIPLLEKVGIKEFFDFFGTKEVSTSKVEKFKIIEEKYSVAKTDMIFVTDTLGDIREADTAGILTVAVTWGAHDTSYFTREPHDNLKGIVDSVAELKDFLNL